MGFFFLRKHTLEKKSHSHAHIHRHSLCIWSHPPTRTHALTHSQRSVLDTVPGHLQKMPQTANQYNNNKSKKKKRITILMVTMTNDDN